jgi:hypothetical protein
LVRDVELHTGAAYVIMERKSSLYRRMLLGMVSGESRREEGEYLEESVRSFMEDGLLMLREKQFGV